MSVNDVLEWVGRPGDPALHHRELRHRNGDRELLVRRDCHGVLRRIDLTFPTDAMARCWDSLDELGPRQVVVPGILEICDVPALGRIVLTRERIEVTLRMAAPPDRVRELVELLCLETGTTGGEDGHGV